MSKTKSRNKTKLAFRVVMEMEIESWSEEQAALEALSSIISGQRRKFYVNKLDDSAVITETKLIDLGD